MRVLTTVATVGATALSVGAPGPSVGAAPPVAATTFAVAAPALSLDATPAQDGPSILRQAVEAHGGLEAFHALRDWRIVAERPDGEIYEEYLSRGDATRTLLIKRRGDSVLTYLHDGRAGHAFVDGVARRDASSADEAYYRAHGEYYLRSLPFKWADPGVVTTLDGREELRGRPAWRLRISAEPGTGVASDDVWMALIDRQTHLLMEARLDHDVTQQTWLEPPRQGRSAITYRFDDYRAVGADGLLMPYRMEYWAGGERTGWNVILEVAVDRGVEAALFEARTHEGPSSTAQSRSRGSSREPGEARQRGSEQATRPPEGPLQFGGFVAEFAAGGEFRIAGEGWPELAGTWAVSGTEMTLTMPEARDGCRGPGSYRFEATDGELHLEAVEDGCVPRRMILSGSTWRPAGAAIAMPERTIRLDTAEAPPPLPEPADPAGSWPSFRGRGASGVADGQDLPDRWDPETGENILWRTAIPGLAHSSPVVWGDRVFVTSAISSRPDASFRPGLYGDGDASDDRSEHRWMIYALDKHTGEMLWERAAHVGEPVDRRHVKSTYASSTPVTDGRLVVAAFGSQGVHAYDVDGNFRWSVDLGRLDLGAYDIPTFEWGPASSPILWNGLVILQCDTQQDSFVIALDAETGEPSWKTERDEMPSWGTPSVIDGPGGAELVTNAPNFIRGYDPRTGEELWRLGGSSKITAPTPIFADGRVIVASGRRPERPIFALRPGARGDITLPETASNNDSVVWSLRGRGPYMPTPLAYGGILYVLANNGVLDAYGVADGEEIYRTRIPHLGSGFSGSPIGADGKIYLPNEDGDIVVVAAGREFEHIATNSMGELLMATPALSEGVMYVRTVGTLFAIGRR